MKTLLLLPITLFMFCQLGLSKAKFEVALCFDDSLAVRWKIEKHFISEKVKEYGGATYTHFANGNSQLQKEQINAMIDKKVDVIVIVASDGAAIAPLIQLANKKKIKIVAYDRLIPDCHLEYYISFDNVDIGQKMANACVKIAPQGNYVLLGGPQTDNNSLLLHQGQLQILNNSIKDKQVQVIHDSYLSSWTEAEAYSTMVEILKQQPQIDVVIAANDVIAAGALKAINEYQHKKVVVTGQDAELEALTRVNNGEQAITIYKPIKNLAKICAELVVDIATNHTSMVNRNIKKVNNGYEEVSAILLPSILVTATNTNTIQKEIASYTQFY